MITSVEVLFSTQNRIRSKKKVIVIMVYYSAEYQLILGLGRVRVMPYYSAEYSDSTRHIPSLDLPIISRFFQLFRAGVGKVRPARPFYAARTHIVNQIEGFFYVFFKLRDECQ